MTRTLFVFLLVLTTVSAFAQDKAAKEPAALVKERKAYEAEIKAAVDPITAAYLKKLDEMKKEFGAKGDLASAQAVQKEIESLTATATIVATWVWSPKGDIAEFQENGTFIHKGNHAGKWKCLDKKARKYLVTWSNGNNEWMLMSSDGMTLTITNNQGTWTAKRLPNDPQ